VPVYSSARSSIMANATVASVRECGTRRFDTWLLIGCGVVAAAQVGKAIISMPAIRAEMALGLDVAGLIVATFATLGALTGICAGVGVRRIGVRESLVGGMIAIAMGNVIGCVAPNAYFLLSARLIEGIGFFGAVLAIPSMLARVVKGEDRDFTMAVWSAYMPAGITLMLLIGPLLPVIGWRNLWFASALIAASSAVLLTHFAPHVPSDAERPTSQFFSEVASVLRQKQCLTVAFAFFAYSCQIFSMAFALPLLLTSIYGMPLGQAGLMSGLILAVSTMGHISSGFLLRAGVPIWVNIATAFGFFVIASFGVYGLALPATAVAVIAALALGIGGLAPGSLYAAAPQVAPSPDAVPPTIGMVQQASNLGQFAGPLALGTWVQYFGWDAAPILIAPIALLGLAAAFVIRSAHLQAARRGL
jgi:MFS transporter, DHA1 family, inner membrane transport protein